MTKKSKEVTDVTPTVEKNHNIVKSKGKHTIQYDFTADELAQKSRELANSIKTKEKIAGQKKEMMSSFKYQLDGQDALINSLSNDIQTGHEMRHVDCEIVKDFEKGTKEYWFEGKLHDTVKLSAADHQLHLDEIEEANAESETFTPEVGAGEGSEELEFDQE